MKRKTTAKRRARPDTAAKRRSKLARMAATPGMTLRRIGHVMGFSRERARRVLAEAGLRLVPLPNTAPSHVQIPAALAPAEPMTPEDFQQAVEDAGLTLAALGRLLGINARTTRRWAQPEGAPGHRAISPLQQARINVVLEAARTRQRKAG